MLSWLSLVSEGKLGKADLLISRAAKTIDKVASIPSQSYYYKVNKASEPILAMTKLYFRMLGICF